MRDDIVTTNALGHVNPLSLHTCVAILIHKKTNCGDTLATIGVSPFLAIHSPKMAALSASQNAKNGECYDWLKVQERKMHKKERERAGKMKLFCCDQPT